MNLKAIIFSGILFLAFTEGGEPSDDVEDIQCDRYERKCENGLCIQSARFCDGKIDCTDNSDEKNCESAYCDGRKSFLCKGGECIDKELVCDGNVNCLHKDDEEDCDNQDCEDEFKCDNSICLDMKWRCDGNKDCADGSDEIGCSIKDGHCLPSQFTCKNMKCIPSEHRCDNKTDCLDNDDEEHCGELDTCFKKNGYFLCTDNSTCLNRAALCNENSDCPDGSDEGGKCNVKCGEECMHTCYETPSGPMCYCDKGYKLVKNGRCEDVDECDLEISVCDHFCTNTNPGFRCSCDSGYNLVNETDCVSNTPGPAMMIFSVGNDIEAKYVNKKLSWKVFKGKSKVSSVAYDPVDKMVYWVSDKTVIYRKKMRFEQEQVNNYGIQISVISFRSITSSELFIHQVGTLEAERIAIDWMGRNLYVTDNKQNHILVCSLLNKVCTILSEDISSPRSIQLDLENRYFYYSNIKEGTIDKVAMDGSSKETIVEKNLDWPNGIALDPPAERLYWLDALLDAVESADYSGNNRKQLPKADVTHPFSLAIWESKLYWTEWTDRGQNTYKSIHGCRKIDGRNQTIEYRSDFNAVNGLTIYHISMFQKVFNPCSKHQCSHICLLSPTEEKSFKCACPLEMVLDRDGHTCVESKISSLFAAVLDGREIKLIYFNIRTHGVDESFKWKSTPPSLTSLNRMNFGHNNDYIYMTNGQSGDIYNLDYVDNNLTLVHSIKDRIIAFSVDLVRKNIYYITEYSRHVGVINYEKRVSRLLEANATQATDLAVDSVKRYLFMSDNGPAIPKGCIFRCSLNGSYCLEVITNIRLPSSIALDQNLLGERLYWTSKHEGEIWSALYDGSYVIKHVEGIQQPSFITVGSKYVFWISNDGGTYGSAEKKELGNKKETPIETIGFSKLLAIQTKNAQAANIADPCKNSKCPFFCFPLNKEEKADCECPTNQVKKVLAHDDGEASITCVTVVCGENQFQCEDGECISHLVKCDKNEDCNDGSDESNCMKGCNNSSYECRDGSCIPKSSVCDSFYDCPDHSDELGCKKQCDSENDWTCVSGDECIPKYWRCNGDVNCKDESDEKDCHNNICEDDHMRCSDGACISKKWICDKDEDCKDGEDEKNCACSEEQFKCTSGQCVPKNATCDGKSDCDDESDEACEDSIVWMAEECGVNLISCMNEEPLICIGQDKICDGHKDCPNGRDEQSCPLVCQPSLKKCPTEERCIPEDWFCDGKPECDYATDEMDCEQTIEFGCFADEFQCDNVSDSDCIPERKVCDHVQDCDSGSDEMGKCNACSKNNGGCIHVCHNHPNGPRCSCHKGFKRDDGKTCEDIDECIDETTCHQKCTNTKGSFVCSCYEGYELTAKGERCKAIGKENNFAIMVSENHIELYTENFFKMNKTMKLPENVVGENVELDYESVNGTFVVLDKITKKFYQQNGTGWNQLHFNVTNPVLLTIDDDRSNVYIVEKLSWQNTTISVFMLCSLTTQACTVINRITRGNVTSVIVSSALQKGYFCVNTEGNGHLYVMNLEGNPRVIHESKILSCDALHVDGHKAKIFYADNTLGTIGSVAELGSNYHKRFSRNVRGVQKLAYLYHSLFWQNFPSRNVFSCSFYQEDYCKETMFDGRFLGNVLMELNTVDNRCKEKNCEHLCTLNHGNPFCLCPAGFKWEKNNTVCVQNPNADKITNGLKCLDSPCQNNGTCTDVHEYQVMCSCPNTFTGKLCERKIQNASNIAGWLFGILLFSLIMGIIIWKRKTICGNAASRSENYRFWTNRGLINEEVVPEGSSEDLLPS